MPKKRFNNLELASLANDPYTYGSIPTFGKIRINPKDRILVENGGTGSDSLELYLNLLTDNQVYAQWDRQMNEITSRNWFLEAGGDSDIDMEALDFVENSLKNLSIKSQDSDKKSGVGIINNGHGLDGLTRGLGLSLITGISIAEIIWAPDLEENKGPIIQSIKIRDPRRFHFDADKTGNIYIKLRTRNHWHEGIFVPPRKFIIQRYWSIPNDDPYGNGIGRLLYYPVQWKRELLTLWLTIVDKYSNPTTVGTYESDISEEEKRIFDNALYNISRDMVISMPSNFDVKFISPSLSSVDLLSDLEKTCNTYISKVISGEANTGELGSEGSTKQTVSNSIRITKAKGFSDLISESINNTLIKWMVQYRYPGAKPPKLWRNFDDSTDTIELLTRIKTLGFNTTKEFIENLTGIPIESPREKRFSL